MENNEKQILDDDFDFDSAVLFDDSVKPTNQVEELEEGNEVEEEAGSEEDFNTHVSSNTAIQDESTQENLDTSSAQNAEGSKWAALAKFFAEEGWISEFDESKFDGSLESIRDMMNQSLNKKFDEGISEYKGTLEPLTQRIQNALEAGIPEETVVNHFKDVKSFQKIDKTKLTENESQLKALYSMYYKATTKFSDEKISKLIDKKIELQDFDDSEEVYDEYNKYLMDHERNMIAAAEQEELRQEEEKKNTIQNIYKTIDESKELMGVKVTPVLREQIKKEFQTIRTKDGQEVRPIVATRMKNPLEFDVAISIIHSLGLLNIDEKGKWNPDLSKLNNNLKSKVTKELEEAFGKGQEIRTGKPLDLSGVAGNVQEKAKDLEKYLDSF